MRHAARIDSNQTKIIKELRRIGCFVYSLAAVGKGIPDLLVGFRGRWVLLECKDGNKPKSKQALTPDQKQFLKQLDHRAPVGIVTCVEDAIETVMGL